MLENYMQKQNEILEILRYFKASQLVYHLNFFSVVTMSNFGGKSLFAR
jgi:hypothetical protein